MDPPHTLYAAFHASALRYGDRIALHEAERRLTFAELDAEARRLAGVLMDRFGLARGESVALFAEKCFAWPRVSLALQAAGAVEHPRETTLEDQDLREFFADRRVRLVFVQNAAVARRVAACLPRDTAIQVISMEPDEAEAVPAQVIALDVLCVEAAQEEVDRSALIQARQSELKGDDTAAVIRTSGTTGAPKLVRLSHANFLYNIRTLPDRVGLSQFDRVLSCLPAWHLYARVVEYTAFVSGAEVVYCQIPEIETALVRYRPTVLPGFPEIWERAFHKILAGVEALPWPLRLAFRVLSFGSRQRYAAREKIAGVGWRIKDSFARRFTEALSGCAMLGLFEFPHWIGDLLFYRRVRAVFGGRLRVAIIGDAPLPRFIDENLRALGFRVLEGYGSTEQNVSALRDARTNALGTAGRPLPGTLLQILDDENRPLPPGRVGRIAVAGPGVFRTYDRPPHAPPEFVTLDGREYYISGDVGLRDGRGNLRLIGREKNRFRLAGGGIVSPERIENVLRGGKFVGQVAVTGRDRPYLCALIVPDLAELVLVLRRRRRRSRSLRPDRILHKAPEGRFMDRPEFLERVVRLPVVQRLYENEVRRLCRESDLKEYEVPYRIVLVGTPFVPGQELTPTLKLRRSIIEHKYYGELDAEYERERFRPRRNRLRLALLRVRRRWERPEP